VVEVDTLERRREQIRIALATDLPVGDHVEARLFLRLDRQDRGIVLGFGEVGFRDAPQLARPYPRRKSSREPPTVNEPLRLRVTTDQHCWKAHLSSPSTNLIPTISPHAPASCSRAPEPRELPDRAHQERAPPARTPRACCRTAAPGAPTGSRYAAPQPAQLFRDA